VFIASESEEQGCTAIVDYESWQHARGFVDFISRLHDQAIIEQTSSN